MSGNLRTMRLLNPKSLIAALSIGLMITACGPENKEPTPDPKPAEVVTTLDFKAFDGKVKLREGKSKKLSLDAEPEYIAVSKDGKTAFVALQESNGLAVVDIANKKVTAVKSLGLKDYNKEGNGLDASDKDGKINIKKWPVYGAYMPDAIASVDIDGKTYILSANEGDGREYEYEKDGKDEISFTDETRVGKMKLDAKAFPNAAELQKDENLGRMKASSIDGDTDGDGDVDKIVGFGARSLTIWDTDVKVVADTGDLFEQKTAELSKDSFNSNGTKESFDSRSDDKGPEPEGVTTGKIGNKTFAFVGLERVSGVVVMDISKPSAPAFVDYAHKIDRDAVAKEGKAGDIGPEGVLFIPAADSPNGKDLLVVSYEMSGSVTMFVVAKDGKLSEAGRYQAEPAKDIYGEGVAEITAYDKASKSLFVINGSTGGIDILDISDVAKPKLGKSIKLDKYGKAANSVAVNNGVVAVAVAAEKKTDNGKVALLKADGSELAKPVTVGALPDMLTFTPDGKHILVANEGEPNDEYTIDPEGSVSIINVEEALKLK